MRQNIYKLSFLIIGIFVAIGASYLNAWTGPPPNITAPNGNVPAPVNVGSLEQTKNGILKTVSFKSWGPVSIATSTTDTYSISSNLLLGLNGSIGASQYCDASGQNCVTPPLASVAGTGMPPGSVVYMASASCPPGFLLANGDSVSRTQYPGLFGVIGTTFGSESASTFSIPDLRGYFIRSAGTNSDGTASGAFGAKQADAFKTHTHTGNTNSAGAHTHSYVSGNQQLNANFQVGGGRWVGTIGVTTNTTSAGSHNHTVSINANTDGGGTETRPDNIALTACIKF